MFRCPRTWSKRRSLSWIGFSGSANAGGRLTGILLSGLIDQIQGLEGCLWWSTGFVLSATLLSLWLLPVSASTAREVAAKVRGETAAGRSLATTWRILYPSQISFRRCEPAPGRATAIGGRRESVRGGLTTASLPSTPTLAVTRPSPLPCRHIGVLRVYLANIIYEIPYLLVLG